MAPSVGDGTAPTELINRIGLNVPILLRACNHKLDEVDVHSARDAFCGKLSVANNFGPLRVSFTQTTSHSCDIDSDEFLGALDRFACVCRIGLFRTIPFLQKLLLQSGMKAITADLSELLAAAEAIRDDDKNLMAGLERIRGYGRIPATS